jgi:hypothetical protein
MRLRRIDVWLLPALFAVAAADAFVPTSSLFQDLSTHRKSTSSRHRNENARSTRLTTQHSDSNDELDGDNPQPDEVVSAADEIPRGGGASIRSKPPALPTLADYRRFALPCLGLWVAQPLLSLVDTAFVGLSGSTAQSASNLAALGPATTFFDGATYLFAFLNVATTNLYSTARAKYGENSQQAEGVVRTASRVAMRCGVGLMFFLLAFARPLLALYIGECPCWIVCEAGNQNKVSLVAYEFLLSCVQVTRWTIRLLSWIRLWIMSKFEPSPCQHHFCWVSYKQHCWVPRTQ